MKRPSAVIVGAGHRSLVYASNARQRPEEQEIVGAATPTPCGGKQVQALYERPSERCFETAEELPAAPRSADLAINGTM
ncbi:MAG TPA: gfo/Idh/MocA family oxidoreductase, partial [Candidatus Latescibacteria bacterium]|nr:gfo/Idh/MocA family oxidoreductase [Candidatus Latescibacterota bacterium]